MNIRTIIKKIIPQSTREFLKRKKVELFPLQALRRLSYSQEGEDLVLARIFETKKTTGFYVDVGAHHPIRFSNTFHFYKKGWTGINIDAMPGSMKAFKKYRNRDTNIECGVAATPGTLTYYEFNDGALNGFNKDLTAMREKNTPYKLLAEVEVKVNTLGTILHENIKPDQHIDFMSIDVEGLDFDVLKSNDWDAFVPSVICIECLGTRISSIQDDPIAAFLATKGYFAFAKTYNTVFYVQESLGKELGI
jgi:FkbM family methyltransferase